MARTDPQVNFRMPQELRDKLEDAAKENKRTLTAEIVARLEETFEEPPQKNVITIDYELNERMKALEKILKSLTNTTQQPKK